MTKENIKLNVIASFDDDLNILNDLKATNEHELEILEKLNDICIGTLSDMIIRNFNKKQKESVNKNAKYFFTKGKLDVR